MKNALLKTIRRNQSVARYCRVMSRIGKTTALELENLNAWDSLLYAGIPIGKLFVLRNQLDRLHVRKTGVSI